MGSPVSTVLWRAPTPLSPSGSAFFTTHPHTAGCSFFAPPCRAAVLLGGRVLLCSVRTNLLSLAERQGPPRFLGNPLVRALVSDSGGSHLPCQGGMCMLPSVTATASAPTIYSISKLNVTARTFAVYASRVRLPAPAQDSLLTGGQPWSGRCLTCWIPNEISILMDIS